MAIDPAAAANFQKIKRFVVIMLENRSFDHLVGGLAASDVRVAGLTGSEFNQKNPNSPGDPAIRVRRAASFVMSFDPAHEFYDVQVQLYGPLKGTDPSLPPLANVPIDPAPMSGFVANASQAVDFSGDEDFVMDYFQPDQLPVLSKLVNEFALFNYWYSSLPGPTWPNRFFIHAATSAGLTDSPSTTQIISGFSFANGTIYERVKDSGKGWCIYHDGLPQTAGVANLRSEFIDPFTKSFRDIEKFFQDIKAGNLADYNFIEPRYDTGNNYLDGNSMHPLNDIRKGEALVKRVYEGLRNSPYWLNTMLIITFDEHGGFYDHQSPPGAIPPADGSPYANPNYTFRFDRFGVRVPAVVVSAYTAKGTVIGTDPDDASTTFDHSSVLATVEKRFQLKALTKRDAAANTLEVALNSPSARDADAPTVLPDPAPDSAVSGPAVVSQIFAADPQAPLSANQKAMAALALACDLATTPPAIHAALISNSQKLVEQKDAADYIKAVESKIVSRRTPPSGA